MRNRLRENIRCGVIVQKYHTSAFSRCKILIHLLWRDDHRGPRGAGLADPKPRWLQYDMEVFRVGQSDVGGLHSVDPHGLSRAGEEGIHPHPRPRLVYDRRLCLLPHGEQYCFRPASCRGLCYWRRRGTGYCSVVHGVAEEDACWGQGVMQPIVHRVALRC